MGPSQSLGAAAVAGIDRWRKGWVVARLQADDTLALSTFATIDEVLDVTNDVHVVAIDMPMSLPISGRRAAEVDLKAHLGAAGRSIFYSPTTAAIACDSRLQADERNRAAGAGGISAQSWGLAGSIRELRNALHEHPQQTRWWETHPESSFLTMQPGGPLASKRSAFGVTQRLGLLAPEFGDVLQAIAAAELICPLDDALDAIAAAWSARRISLSRDDLFGPDGRDADGFALGIRI